MPPSSSYSVSLCNTCRVAEKREGGREEMGNVGEEGGREEDTCRVARQRHVLLSHIRVVLSWLPVANMLPWGCQAAEEGSRVKFSTD